MSVSIPYSYPASRIVVRFLNLILTDQKDFFEVQVWYARPCRSFVPLDPRFVCRWSPRQQTKRNFRRIQARWRCQRATKLTLILKLTCFGNLQFVKLFWPLHCFKSFKSMRICFALLSSTIQAWVQRDLLSLRWVPTLFPVGFSFYVGELFDVKIGWNQL